MKKLVLLALFFGTSVAAFGEVSVRVCLADGNTPFEYQDIMVGTKLTFIVDSNVAEEWYGGALVVEEANMVNIGSLYGRGYDGFEYPGSCLPDAGEWAAVWDTVVPGHGFEFVAGEEPNVGDWFVFDYNSIDIGDCNVAFYDFDVNEIEPIDVLAFHHVRTRDFNGDYIVDLADFAVLTTYWLVTDCNEPDWCEGTDLDISHNVDFIDFALFCDFWLEKTQ